VLVGVAGDNVLRLAPPLVITEDEIRQAVDAIDAVLASANGGSERVIEGAASLPRYLAPSRT
jgi:acetylornithine/succinyldiaminopimelate/putrescine aminotransferase